MTLVHRLRPGPGPLSAAAAGIAALLSCLAPAATAGSAPPPRCRPAITGFAQGQGAPDDLAMDGSRILVSDVKAGTLGVVRRGHVTTLLRHVAEPEGIIVRSPTQLELAAQGPNQILSVDLARHRTRVLSRLPSVTGHSGLDSIEAAPGGATYAPDSANGTVYRLYRRRLEPIATGLIRPVDAWSWHGGLAIADEYANYVYLQSGSRRRALAHILLPDDLAVVAGHLLVTSQSGQLWEIAPHVRLITGALKYPQGMVAEKDGSVLVSEQSVNRIVRVSGLTGCL